MNGRRFCIIVATLILAGLFADGSWLPAWGAEPPHATWGQAPPGEELPLTEPPDGFKPGRLLVKFRGDVSASVVGSLQAQYGATHVRDLLNDEVSVWQVPQGQEIAIAAQLSGMPEIEYAEPDYVYRAFFDPNDPYLYRQWAHNVIHSKAAWDITAGSASTIIAIIDTGIDETHPDLSGKIVYPYDFVDDDSNPHDTNGHGTHVAGIAAAWGNNSTGAAGLDWTARIMPLRVLNTLGSGYTSDIVDGITWAYQHGAHVINMSLGGTTYSQSMQDAINAAHAAGSLVVAAMGNCRVKNSSCPTANPISYPAAYNNVMAVAATGPGDTYSYFSQYGAHCDIAAPGGEMSYLHDSDGIYSTMPTYSVWLTAYYGYYQNYDYLQGTSQATPYVAGLAGLVRALSPSLTPDEIQAIIQNTATDLGTAGWDQTYGYGRIDAQAALQAFMPPVSSLRVTSAISDTHTMTTTLRWNAPQGAQTIDLRYDDDLITDATWNSATSLTSSLAGTAETYVAITPYTGDTVYFALKWQNADSDWSDVSNNALWPARQIFLPLIR
jgi:thermitase